MVTKEEIAEIRHLFASPLFFIEKFWKLKPQKLVCEATHEHKKLSCYEPFNRGEHITWQQAEVLRAIEAGKNRITVRSGNGIGKDALLSWLIHWYLFTHYQAQIGCTAPSSEQLYDVLWKEISIWRERLPEGVRNKFEWTTDRFRITEQPEVWWARARTARIERPEAFAGLHGKYVFLVGDESSGIPDEIFSAGEGALTGENTLVVLVGNPIRLEGYFYETQENPDYAGRWTRFAFNGLESPIVKNDFVEEVIATRGVDSDEYNWKVLGEFPKKKGMWKGWMPLLEESELKYCPDTGSFKNATLGIDPAGEGSNKTAIVLRDNFMAKVLLVEDKSNPKGIAESALTFSIHYNFPTQKIVIDNFGIGANIGMELVSVRGEKPRAVNVGNKPDNHERFTNMRAELYWRAREWILKGGLLVRHPEWKQLLTIRYKRTGTGRLQIISKKDLKELFNVDSPDVADGFALTFLGDNESLTGSLRTELSAHEVAELTAVY